MLGDLGAFTLRSIKTMIQFSSLSSIKPAMLPTSMLGDYSTSVSPTPSCFPRRIDLLGNLFPITSLLNLPFSSFLDHHTGHPAATMLGYYSMSASSMPSKFSSSFRSIGNPLPIGRHLTCLSSARLQTSRLLSRFVPFFLDRHACHSTCR
jgi:hypothetical protein